jgi:hypothetical protein
LPYENLTYSIATLSLTTLQLYSLRLNEIQHGLILQFQLLESICHGNLLMELFSILGSRGLLRGLFRDYEFGDFVARYLWNDFFVE